MRMMYYSVNDTALLGKKTITPIIRIRARYIQTKVSNKHDQFSCSFRKSFAKHLTRQGTRVLLDTKQFLRIEGHPSYVRNLNSSEKIECEKFRLERDPNT